MGIGRNRIPTDRMRRDDGLHRWRAPQRSSTWLPRPRPRLHSQGSHTRGSAGVDAPICLEADPQASVSSRSHKSLGQCGIFSTRDSRWYSRSGATQPLDVSLTHRARDSARTACPFYRRGDDGTKKMAARKPSAKRGARKNGNGANLRFEARLYLAADKLRKSFQRSALGACRSGQIK